MSDLTEGEKAFRIAVAWADDDMIARAAGLRLALDVRMGADPGWHHAVRLFARGEPVALCCVGETWTAGGRFVHGVRHGGTSHLRSHSSAAAAWECAERRWPGLRLALLRRQARDQAEAAG